MPVTKLKKFLDAEKVEYTSLAHSTAYTAQEIASLTHVRGQELAKTVIVKLDGRMAMAVLPATLYVDLSLLKGSARAKTISLASEEEFRDLFPGCETGAMPPFGNLYGLPVFVDDSLTKDKAIAFNAGTHNELIQLPFKDFVRLAHPTIISLAVRAAA